MKMIVCQTCGDKRCIHANDRNAPCAKDDIYAHNAWVEKAIAAKDAERYRWLRDTNRDGGDDSMRASGHLEPLQVERIYFGRPVDKWFMHDFAFAPSGDAFDAAVDAAIDAARGKP